jgi:hypothetical protein
VSNRILSVALSDVSLVPAEAVVRVVVTPERLDACTEVRGRLMGPRCRFAGTVEVAYHLRKLSSDRAVTLRAVIPEASLWEPQTPHLYAGPVELWQDGQRCEVVNVRHGLRYLALGPRGLRVNGHLLRLRGRRVTRLEEAAALALRESGYNLVVAPVTEESRAIWEVADRIGLFVLGRAEGESALAEQLTAHPSCLGWIRGDEGEIAGQAGATFSVRASGEANGDGPVLLDAPAGQGGESVLGVIEG